jgi:hypothetical protein
MFVQWRCYASSPTKAAMSLIFIIAVRPERKDVPLLPGGRQMRWSDIANQNASPAPAMTTSHIRSRRKGRYRYNHFSLD